MAETMTAPKSGKAPEAAKGNGKADKPATDPGKPVESKGDKFKRLANMRLPRAGKLLRNIANLGNRNQYDYTEEQAGKLLAYLQDELNYVKQRFAGNAKSDVPTKIF